MADDNIKKPDERNNSETVIEFPCDFPIKIMGETHHNFTNEIVCAIQSIQPEFNANNIVVRGSTGGKYTSLTCTVHVTSKTQLDDIYRMLTAHHLVKFAL